MTMIENTFGAASEGDTGRRSTGGVAEDEPSECPAGRPGEVERQIVGDVYGCPAGRDCAQVALTQRIVFEMQIADRIAKLSPQKPDEAA